MTINIGPKLKTRRQQMGLTQLELANKIKVSESYICQIEKGKMVSLRKLEQIAKELKCEAKDLL
ncbi:MAG: helix-turn-helix transcriptional regulator [Thermoplasmatales archaeon]|nr:MAG: helix-turn-helix transcriptional regulator [Thermoplasmatales archaeon]